MYGSHLYFGDNRKFEAGYGTSGAADCVGTIVVSWTPKKALLQFGNSDGSFAHWYLSNGDGYSLSLKGALWGGRVNGLS